MPDVAPLEFAWQRAQPIAAARRAELLALPGFGDTYSDQPAHAAIERTLLAGVTRDSILRLARRLGYPVAEEPITLDEWERGCRDGRITETFACGTTRAVVPVGHVASAQRERPVGDGTAGPVTARLRKALLDIQYGQTPDEFGWMRLVDTEEE